MGERKQSIYKHYLVNRLGFEQGKVSGSVRLLTYLAAPNAQEKIKVYYKRLWGSR